MTKYKKFNEETNKILDKAKGALEYLENKYAQKIVTVIMIRDNKGQWTTYTNSMDKEQIHNTDILDLTREKDGGVPTCPRCKTPMEKHKDMYLRESWVCYNDDCDYIR